MTLRVSLSETRRTLRSPVANARLAWAERRTGIITLEGDSGLRGFGEASPLPGFSPDGLDSCLRALADFDASGLPTRLEAGQSALAELGSASRRLPENVPAARAALEGALLDLWSREAGLPAWALLVESGQIKPEPRAIAALLMGEPEQALSQAQAAQERGVQTFKFKIGRPGALDRELAATGDLRTELGDLVKLRLDANQCFGLAEARACLPRFAAYGLEFVEEPCSRGDLPKLTDLGVPLALDESLPSLGSEIESQLRFLGVRALVLKPTLLGGISACAAWAKLAGQIGVNVVISHAFEGPVGFALCAALALSVGSAEVAHGLDPEGARLRQGEVPGFAGAHIGPWDEPGWGSAGPNP